MKGLREELIEGWRRLMAIEGKDENNEDGYRCCMPDGSPYPVYSLIPYEEVPEETRDYADFVMNTTELKDNLGMCDMTFYGFEEQRINLHKKMVKRYGLRYEYTRNAVYLDPNSPNITKFSEKRYAQIIDAYLRWLKDKCPESRVMVREENE